MPANPLVVADLRNILIEEYVALLRLIDRALDAKLNHHDEAAWLKMIGYESSWETEADARTAIAREVSRSVNESFSDPEFASERFIRSFFQYHKTHDRLVELGENPDDMLNDFFRPSKSSGKE